jgi:hypothetical protein
MVFDPNPFEPVTLFSAAKNRVTRKMPLGEHTCEGKSKDKSIGEANFSHYDDCHVY